MRDREPVRGRVNVIVLVKETPYIVDVTWIQQYKSFGRPINQPLVPLKWKKAARLIIERAMPGTAGTFANIGRPEGRFKVEQFVVFTPEEIQNSPRAFEVVDKTWRFGERTLELLQKCGYLKTQTA